MADLVEFAAGVPRATGVPCWACTIPQAAQINAAKRDRTASVPQMIRWLIDDQGIDPAEARDSRLANHFQHKHHIRWPDGRTA